MASLTEAAKAVLEGKVLEEGAYPEVSPGKISNPNPVDPSTASTGNAKTLRPNSKAVEGRHPASAGAPDVSSFGGVDDLGGATPTSTAKENLGAKAAGKTGKDTSKSAKANVAAEPAKKLSEDDEVEGDTIVAEADETAIAERVAIIKEAAKKAKEKEEKHEEPDGDEGKCMKEEEEFELSEELEAFIEEGIEAGLSEEEILAAIDENFELVSEEESAVEDYQVDMSEHVNALLEGENLSEEFHAKATTIFEAAVKAKLEEEVALLEQAYAETLEERVAEIQEQLAADVDNYLNYVVEQWIEENEVAVESALRSELTEDFISGLRALFAEHYIDVPEDTVNVVEELSQTVEELESKLNEEIERNVALTGMISESRKSELTSYVCEGLTTTQAEKLKSLVEGVEYSNDDEFITKISTLRENYFPSAVKTDNVLDRVEMSDDPQALTEESLNGPMSKYVNAIGRRLPR
jgi:hypothetical protein